MANENLGASFSIDTTDLKAGLAQANRMIRESESEFKAAAAGMDDWSSSEDGLNAKIKSLNSITDLQRKKVDALQGEYDNLIANGLDPTSRQATELRTKINNETAALNKNEAELKKQSKALDELADDTKDAADATDEAAGSFEKLKAAGGVIGGVVAGVGAACAGAIGAFLGLAESTQETQTQFAKLEQSFNSAGHEFDYALDTLYGLQGVLGDTDRAVEASNFLAKVSKDEKDLEANTRILTGVFAEYGESIPTEGLAEGIAATAEMGTVQGVLADALEWQGVNLDDHNAKLATLATAEERAAYTQQVLTELYGESADAYRENNEALIEANNAQLRLEDNLAGLGEIAFPIMTESKNLASDLLGTIYPFVSLIGEGLTGALNGADGAAESLAEGLNGILTTVISKVVEAIPFVINTIIAIFPKLLTEILGQLPSILGLLLNMISQIAFALGEMLPTLIPVIIDAVLMLEETALDNIDMLINAGIALLVGLADGLIKALPKLIDKIPVIIQKLMTALSNNYPKLVQAGVQLLVSLAGGLIQAIPQLISKIPQIITSIVSGFKNYKSKMLDVGKDLIKGLWNGISNMASWIKSKIQGFGKGVLNNLKDFFGIHSPSRVMADEIGKNLALGIGEGFADNIKGVNADITSAMNFTSPKPNGNGGGGVGNVVVNQYNTYSQAHSRYELYKSKQQTAAAVRLAMAGG